MEKYAPLTFSDCYWYMLVTLVLVVLIFVIYIIRGRKYYL